MCFGDLSINRAAHHVALDKQSIALTTQEFELLVLLASHAGQVLSRDDIYRQLRGLEYDGDNPRRIKTGWGKGYLFVADAWN